MRAESICGIHTDDLFAYETQKVVRIRDRRLGVLYYTLTVLIAAYVLGYQILYRNEHFERRDVFGTPRVTLQQPTKRGCNPNKPDCKSDFDSLEALPYCSVYTGASSVVTPKNRHICIFADQHTLAPSGMLDGNMLVPTRIDEMVETKGCEPSPSNHWSCDNEFNVDHLEEVRYVADVEKYTIMLAHTYKRDTVMGNNGDIKGVYLQCEQANSSTSFLKSQVEGANDCEGRWVRQPIECLTGNCHFLPEEQRIDIASSLRRSVEKVSSFLGIDSRRHNDGNLRHRNRPAMMINRQDTHTDQDREDTLVQERSDPTKVQLAKGGVYSIRDGDIFSLSKLLELTDLSLDRTFNKDGEPLREAGTVIEIEIRYSNLVPWLSTLGYLPVSYEYKVTQRPLEEMKTELVAQQQPKWPKERIIENRHGLYIVAKITGSFGFFSIVYLLIMLTTAVSLLAVAVFLTDKLAMYWMEDKEKYREKKYEHTEVIGEGKDS